MPRYKIEGGQPLEGTITISGAKNAAVADHPCYPPGTGLLSD